MKDQSNDTSHHERTVLPRHYISLPVDNLNAEHSKTKNVVKSKFTYVFLGWPCRKSMNPCSLVGNN